MVRDRTVAEQKQTYQLLINLGIPYDRLQIPLGDLSWGERRKIAMGLSITDDYDLLILDEPTNHLDLFSREALEESLLQFPGTILLVTHDRYLMERVCDCLLVFENQKIRRIEGHLESYLAKRQAVVPDPDSASANRDDDRLLIDTKISRVLSELSLLKPDAPDYPVLDQECRDLLRLRPHLL